MAEGFGMPDADAAPVGRRLATGESNRKSRDLRAGNSSTTPNTPQRQTNQATIQRRRRSSRAKHKEGRPSDTSDAALHPDMRLGRYSNVPAAIGEKRHPRKIFVGGLAHKTTTQHLRDYFAAYGSIVDAVVLRWPDGRSRGFGYVTFAHPESAAVALGEVHQIGDRDVDVKRAVPGTNKLFIGGLPQNTSHVELREHFEAYGTVSDAVVMIDPMTNRSRGFGFVCFLPGQEGALAVAAALAQYSHHHIRGKWIEVKSAAPPHKLAGKEPVGPLTRSTTPSGSEASTQSSLLDVATFSSFAHEPPSAVVLGAASLPRGCAPSWTGLKGPVKVPLPMSALSPLIGDSATPVTEPSRLPLPPGFKASSPQMEQEPQAHKEGLAGLATAQRLAGGHHCNDTDDSSHISGDADDIVDALMRSWCQATWLSASGTFPQSRASSIFSTNLEASTSDTSTRTLEQSLEQLLELDALKAQIQASSIACASPKAALACPRIPC